MKKLLAPLAVMIMSYGSLNAQSLQKNCGTNSNKVCRLAHGSKAVSCYKTRYAENFKVCKNDRGYFICCESPTTSNSTHPNVIVIAASENYEKYQEAPQAYAVVYAEVAAPANQSYINTAYSASEVNSRKNGTKNGCYVGNNVAASNRAPYEGCPSQQSDGPDANRQRNLNVSNPESMPPLAGQPAE